jgi:hypothetical protein
MCFCQGPHKEGSGQGIRWQGRRPRYKNTSTPGRQESGQWGPRASGRVPSSKTPENEHLDMLEEPVPPPLPSRETIDNLSAGSVGALAILGETASVDAPRDTSQKKIYQDWLNN